MLTYKYTSNKPLDQQAREYKEKEQARAKESEINRLLSQPFALLMEFTCSAGCGHSWLEIAAKMPHLRDISDGGYSSHFCPNCGANGQDTDLGRHMHKYAIYVHEFAQVKDGYSNHAIGLEIPMVDSKGER